MSAVDQFIYVEVADGGINRRGIVKPVEEVNAWGGTEQYSTYVRCTSALLDWRDSHVNENGNPTTKGFRGPMWVDALYIEYDGKDQDGNPDAERSLNGARMAIRRVDGLNIAREAMVMW